MRVVAVSLVSAGDYGDRPVIPPMRSVSREAFGNTRDLRPERHVDVRVCVVGAGFAGLAAAADLAAAGVDVRVFEARDRVGGRVWSVPFDPADPASPVIERGAEFVLAGYDTMAAYASAYGLHLADTGMSYYVRTPLGVPGVDAAAVEAAAQRLMAALDAAGATAGSVADFVRSVGLPPELVEVVLARVEVSCAQQAELVGPSVLRHIASMEPLPSFRIAGGNQQIALGLAADLGDRVRLRTPVRAIDWSDGRARIALDDGVVVADRVIVTVPLPLLRDLPIEPALPAWKHRIWASAVVGMAAKLHVGLASPVATSAVLSVPDRFWSWTARDGSGAVQPVVPCFCRVAGRARPAAARRRSMALASTPGRDAAGPVAGRRPGVAHGLARRSVDALRLPFRGRGPQRGDGAADRPDSFRR